MQQAMRNNRARGWEFCLEVGRKKIGLVGALAGEVVALASLITALAAGLLFLTQLLASY